MPADTEKFAIGTIFTDKYPTEAAIFCNQLSDRFVKQISNDENGLKRWQITESPALSKEETILQISNMLSVHIDKTMRDRGYDSITACISYLNSTVERFKNDAETALQQRDAVYQRLFQIFDQYRRGDLKTLTWEQVYNRLPKILQKDK